MEPLHSVFAGQYSLSAPIACAACEDTPSINAAVTYYCKSLPCWLPHPSVRLYRVTPDLCPLSSLSRHMACEADLWCLLPCSFSLYEPVEFIRHHMMDKLDWTTVRESVAIHVPCSSKKMGIEAAFATVAAKCAKEVVPSGVPCCGEWSVMLVSAAFLAASTLIFALDCSSCSLPGQLPASHWT